MVVVQPRKFPIVSPEILHGSSLLEADRARRADRAAGLEAEAVMLLPALEDREVPGVDGALGVGWWISN